MLRTSFGKDLVQSIAFRTLQKQNQFLSAARTKDVAHPRNVDIASLMPSGTGSKSNAAMRSAVIDTDGSRASLNCCKTLLRMSLLKKGTETYLVRIDLDDFTDKLTELRGFL